MTTERIKEIQSKTAYPESVSVQQALLQVWNETGQEQLRIGDVMRSATEIEMRLEELQLDFDECKKWYDNAYKKYEDDRKYWGKGEADPNEYLEASRQLELIKLQLKTLKWVLGGHLI